MNTFLSGLRVLDFSRLLPGPFCTRLLANLGAEIIKVETPLAGDYLRLTPPEFGLSGMFDVLNAGKQSIAINYRNARGRELLLELVKTADVMVESFRPGGAAKYGLGYESLKVINPRLVYCALSGYGQAGPYRDKGGHDVNYIAIAGLLGVDQEPGLPQMPNVQIADLAGGMLGTLGILAALTQRARTGEGAFVDVALLDGALTWMMPLAAGMLGRPNPSGRGLLTGAAACYNVYACADGLTVTLGALEPNFWSAFCNTVGHAEWINDQYRPTLRNDLIALFQTRPRAEWLELFKNVDACFEPLLTPTEAQAHPHIKARLEHLGFPANGRAAEHGAHTRAVLTQLGVTAEELEVLEKKGVVKLGD